MSVFFDLNELIQKMNDIILEIDDHPKDSSSLNVDAIKLIVKDLRLWTELYPHEFDSRSKFGAPDKESKKVPIPSEIHEYLNKVDIVLDESIPASRLLTDIQENLLCLVRICYKVQVQSVANAKLKGLWSRHA